MSQIDSAELTWILSSPNLPVCYALSPCQTKVTYNSGSSGWSNTLSLQCFYRAFRYLEGRD